MGNREQEPSCEVGDSPWLLIGDHRLLGGWVYCLRLSHYGDVQFVLNRFLSFLFRVFLKDSCIGLFRESMVLDEWLLGFDSCLSAFSPQLC